MKKKINYTDEPIGKVERIADFLPRPEDLILQETNIKVTINLKKTSVEFFKDVAKKNHVQYQKVIRTLLDQYASAYHSHV